MLGDGVSDRGSAMDAIHAGIAWSIIDSGARIPLRSAGRVSRSGGSTSRRPALHTTQSQRLGESVSTPLLGWPPLNSAGWSNKSNPGFCRCFEGKRRHRNPTSGQNFCPRPCYAPSPSPVLKDSSPRGLCIAKYHSFSISLQLR
ncbi:hypothetical protein VTN00DRAFT_1133 [Thermoascus crustaceus]|uniref:uncharacterized protein n=1 Tax=Thermoascus crustaceus TaxID=5088 RepID=UPI003743E56E